LEVDFKNHNLIDDLFKSYQPDYFAHLGSQSSVKKSNISMDSKIDSDFLTLQRLVKSIEKYSMDTKLFFPSSATIYEGYSDKQVNEHTPPKPKTKYAISKLNSQNLLRKKVIESNLNFNTGIMFSHESEFRRPIFFTKKVVEFLVKYVADKEKILYVGNLSIERDIGYAKEYVEAIFKILINNNKTDYIVSSKVLYKLSDFINTCLKILDIDYEIISDGKKISYIDTKNKEIFISSQDNEFRKFDLLGIKGDNNKIFKDLGWSPEFKLYDICEKMIKYELKKMSK